MKSFGEAGEYGLVFLGVFVGRQHELHTGLAIEAVSKGVVAHALLAPPRCAVRSISGRSDDWPRP